MSCKILIISAVLLQLSISASGRLVCPVNNQIVLSTDQTLQNINSSSEDSNINPASLFTSEHNAWCSQIVTEANGQYVELIFTEPVLMVSLISGGFISSYVNNFSISYTLEDVGDYFQTYGALRTQQNFLVANILISDVHFSLEIPILAKRIRFNVNGGMLDGLRRICWRIALFGCRGTEGQTLQDEQTNSETTEGFISTTAFPNNNTFICPHSEVLAQKDLLLIVIPIAVVTIIITLIAVITGILICLSYIKSRQSKLESAENGITTPNYDRPRPPLYDIPRSRSRDDSTSTIGSHLEIKNPAYMTNKCMQDLHHDNDYDVIPDTPTELELRTQSNTIKNQHGRTVSNQAPIRNGVVQGEKCTSNDDLNYSKVNKKLVDNGDYIDRPQTTSPVLNSHYELSYTDISVNQVLAQEIDHLANELERSRSINKR